MADPRRFRGVRLSPQGDAYVQLVATRDRITWSEALRRLLALGARVDMEKNLDGNPRTGVGQGDGVGPVRETPPVASGQRADSGGRSGEVPHVPHSGHDGGGHGEGAAGSGSGTVGDALGVLIHAGFRPETVEDTDPDTAA